MVEGCVTSSSKAVGLAKFEMTRQSHYLQQHFALEDVYVTQVVLEITISNDSTVFNCSVSEAVSLKTALTTL
jgi:hypothetical protein